MEAGCVLPGGTTRPMGRFMLCLHLSGEISLIGFLLSGLSIYMVFYCIVTECWDIYNSGCPKPMDLGVSKSRFDIVGEALF